MTNKLTIRELVAGIVASEQDVLLDPHGTIVLPERLGEVLELWTQDQRKAAPWDRANPRSAEAR